MRILLVTPYKPYQVKFGGQQRTHLLWRALREVATVEVLLLSEGVEESVKVASDGQSLVDATFKTRPLGWRKYLPDARLTKLLNRYVDFTKFDVVCGRYLGPISKLSLPPDIPSIVDLDDLGYRYIRGRFLHSSVWAQAKGFVRSALEQKSLPRFSRFWFVSPRDRDRFPCLYGDVLPNIPLAPVIRPSFESSGKTLLFVGALWYGPNKEGIERFLSRCWPAIRTAEPNACLRLVGGASEGDRANWNRLPGVKAQGFVEDLATEYAEAVFTIAPIYSGGGSNIKILESLAHARTCVTTTFCVESFRPHFNGISDVIAAENENAIIDCCIRLLRDSSRREALAKRGHEIVLTNFSFEAFSRVVHAQIRAIKPAIHEYDSYKLQPKIDCADRQNTQPHMIR